MWSLVLVVPMVQVIGLVRVVQVVRRSGGQVQYSGRPENAKCNFEIKLFVVFGIRGKLMNNRVSVKIKNVFLSPGTSQQTHAHLARV